MRPPLYLRGDPRGPVAAVFGRLGGMFQRRLRGFVEGVGQGARRRRCTTLPPDYPPLAVSGRVSVVLPIKDQAQLLREAIDSVLAQQGVDLELIVVDDGSTDGVDGVLQHYAADPRVRLLRQPHRGLPLALSAGFRFATGSRLTWISADDILEPEMLGRLASFLDARTDVAMVHGAFRAVDETGHPVGPDPAPRTRRGWRFGPLSLRRLHGMAVRRGRPIGPCFLYRGFVARCVGDWTGAMGVEDQDYWMRLGAAFRIEHLGDPRPLYRYRWHGNSLQGRALELRLARRKQALDSLERRRMRRRSEPWSVCVDPSAAPAGVDVAAPDRGEPWSSCGRGDTRQVVWLSAENWLDESCPPSRPGDFRVVDWGAAAAGVLAAPARLDRPALLHVTSEARTAAMLDLFTSRVVRLPVLDPSIWLPFVLGVATTALADDATDAAHAAVEPAALPDPWFPPDATPAVRIVGAPMALSRCVSSLLRAFARMGIEASLASAAAADGEPGRVRVSVRGMAQVPERSVSVVDSDAALQQALADGDAAVLCDFRLLRRRALDVAALERLIVAPADMAPADLGRAVARFALWRATGGETRAARAWFRS